MESVSPMQKADTASFFEQRLVPMQALFFQEYTGEFLSSQEVHTAAHKRERSFSYRTHAHSSFKGCQPIEKESSERIQQTASSASSQQLAKESLGHMKETARAPIAAPEEPSVAPTLLECGAWRFPAVQTERKTLHKQNHSLSHQQCGHDASQGCEHIALDDVEDDITAHGHDKSMWTASNAKDSGAEKTEQDMESLNAASCHESGLQARAGQVEGVEGSARQKVKGSRGIELQKLLGVAADASSHSHYAVHLDLGVTLMVRNIPKNITNNDMLMLLTTYGFAGEVVLLYVPWSIGTHGNVGYGFVHMQSKSAADALTTAWQRHFPFGRHENLLPVNIALASVQGARESFNLWNTGKVKRLRNLSLRPLVLKHAAFLDLQSKAQDPASLQRD